MPRIIVPVPNTDTTITRFVVKTIAEELLYITEMDSVKEIIYVPRSGQAALRQMNQPNEPLKLAVEDHIQITYSEDDDPEFYDINKYQDEYPPFFYAKELGVKLTPIMNRVNLECEFQYTSKSYDTLRQWLNAFKRRKVLGNTSNYHDIVYNYSIPDSILAYLSQVYHATETVAPYNKTLKEFIDDNFSVNGLTIRENLNGSNKQVAMLVKNSNCLGMFLEIPTIIETGKEPPESDLTFKYTLAYDRVTGVVLEYQHRIHNQLLDLVFLNQYDRKRLASDPTSGNLTVTHSVQTALKNTSLDTDYNTVLIAADDGWKPPMDLKSLLPYFVIPIQLDLTDLSLVLDVHDLLTLGYPAPLIVFLIKFKTQLFTPYLGFFYFELFEVNSKVMPIGLSINNQGHLRSTVELNPRNRYYLRLSSLLDIRRVDFSVFLNDIPSLIWVISHLYPWVTVSTSNNGQLLTSLDILDLINQVNNTEYTNATYKTVMSNRINCIGK